MAVKPLQLAVAVCVGLLFGTIIGYTTKPVPEPDVRVKALLTPPFVEVTVNGKAVDLGRIRLVPEQQDKKKKSGDVGEIGELLRPAPFDPPIQHAIFAQRDGGRSVEAFGIETLAKVLLELKEAIFGSKDKPGMKDEIAGGIKDAWASVRTGFIVSGGVALAGIGWIGISLQRIADHTAKSAEA